MKPETLTAKDHDMIATAIYQKLISSSKEAANKLSGETNTAAVKLAGVTAKTEGDRKNSMNGFKKPFLWTVGLVLTLISFSVGIILSNQQMVNSQNNSRLDKTDEKITGIQTDVSEIKSSVSRMSGILETKFSVPITKK